MEDPGPRPLWDKAKPRAFPVLAAGLGVGVG